MAAPLCGVNSSAVFLQNARSGVIKKPSTVIKRLRVSRNTTQYMRLNPCFLAGILAMNISQAFGLYRSGTVSDFPPEADQPLADTEVPLIDILF